MIEIADINLTNLCNARCPQCQRTDINGLGVAKNLPLITWSLNDFMNYFPKNTLDDIKEYSFCGTWGDPLMAKDIEPITYYIMDNSNAKVIITTNGSIRNEDFYTRIGNYSGKRLTIVIDVDGVDEEMHQKYRRGTSLKKSLSALRALSKTKAIPLSQTVLFKHNEKFKDIIKKIAIRNGSHGHNSYSSDRFEDRHIFSDKHILGVDSKDKNTFWFINEDGNKESLEKAIYDKNYM